ncbi:uncharacterized protein LOC111319783 [Stylophora pistillata]|uniref:uncharacterized protein LOC111319783 n=1 Tax=Stylophora pistillata TaxID=50429 RepID=UPI000C05668A|nr:uncharacterized protein LOC111319783 [Stylophora pistillata]
MNKSLFDLALQSQRQGKWTYSLWLYQRLLELSPDNASVYSNMGALFSSHHQFETAVALLKKAIDIDPKHPGALSNLGNAYQRQGIFKEAEKYLKKSIKLAPNHFSAHLNLSIALRRQDKIKEALKQLEKALKLSPDNADAHFNKAVCHLSLGELEKAWPHYEYRWGMREAQGARRQFPQPLWDGQKLEGSTLFIYCEQGFGDAIQFARYIPKAAKHVKQIIVECRPELARVFQRIEGVTNVVIRGQKLPNFDIHIPLLSLPHVFKTTLKSIPKNVPYIAAPEPKQPIQLLENHKKKWRVGLVWECSLTNKMARMRAIELDLFKPLMDIPNTQFYSLQHGPNALDIYKPSFVEKIIDLSPLTTDFLSTAILIENLDLVISIDTSVTHLAGALGKTTWTLLPKVAEWRWMTKGTSSPWYPSMKLFRQKEEGNWEELITRVQKELKSFAKTSKS